MSNTVLKVAQIEESKKVKVRDQLNKLAVQEYADLYASSGADALPPLDIFQEKGCKRWIIADGRHRFAAAKKAGLESLPCKVHEGDDIAALDFAAECNLRHGVRRTDADLATILRSIFNTIELATKYRTDSELSDKVGVSTKTVQRHRAKWRDEDGGNADAKRVNGTRAAKHTKPPTQNVSPRVDSKKPPEPDTCPVVDNSQKAAPKPLPKKTLTDEQRKVGQQVRTGMARDAGKPSKPPLPHDKVHDLKRGAGILATCDLDPERVATDAGISKESWKRARDFINNVLEHL